MQCRAVGNLKPNITQCRQENTLDGTVCGQFINTNSPKCMSLSHRGELMGLRAGKICHGGIYLGVGSLSGSRPVLNPTVPQRAWPGPHLPSLALNPQGHHAINNRQNAVKRRLGSYTYLWLRLGFTCRHNPSVSITSAVTGCFSYWPTFLPNPHTAAQQQRQCHCADYSNPSLGGGAWKYSLLLTFWIHFIC